MVGWSRRMGGGAFIDEWTEGGKPLSEVCISHPSGIRVFLIGSRLFFKASSHCSTKM